MRKGGGKAKGSEFEREISKTLTKWATGQEKPYIFYRSPSSGAVATVSKSENITGDIIAVDETGRFFTDLFSIECKNGYEDADPLKIFKNNKNDTLRSFWEQCILDSRTANKEGILIFRKKGCPVIMGVETDGILDKLMKQKIEINLTISFNNSISKLTFYEFDQFILKITPTDIRNLSNLI